MASSKALELIKKTEAKFVDFRFCDARGKEQHMTMPAHVVDEEFMEEGKMFDGSSIDGWKGINESDMVMMPDDDSAVLDPFFEEPTVNIRCDVLEPNTMMGYERDPRTVAKRAEAYLASPASPIPRFSARKPSSSSSTRCAGTTTCSGAGSTPSTPMKPPGTAQDRYPEGNMGHRPGIKGGYSRSRRSIPSTTSARPCAWRWKKWA